MKKIIIAILMIVAGIALLTNTILHGIEKEKKSFSINVGKKIVVGKDTLTIMDYSTVMETYSLSNGTKVDKSFVDNQLQK